MQKIQKLVALAVASGVAISNVGLAFAQAPTTAVPTSAQRSATPTASSSNNQVALTAVPPRLGDEDYSLRVAPGQTIQAVIEVRNPSDYPVTVETFPRDFIIGADGETPIPVEDGEINTRWQLSSWLTLTPNYAVIEPRGASTILVTIDVPADAMPGGHYAMVLHKPVVNANSTETATGAQINAQVGTLLYVLVDGPVTEEANINTFAFRNFSEMGPVPYEFTIHNGSSMHIRPDAHIIIKNMLGGHSGVIEVDDKNIYPDSSRSYSGQWDKKWGFGRYSAELVATFGTQGTAVTAVSHFWILPIRLILLLLLLIALIIVVMTSTRQKYSKMLAAEEEKVRKLDEKLKKARNRR